MATLEQRIAKLERRYQATNERAITEAEAKAARALFAREVRLRCCRYEDTPLSEDDRAFLERCAGGDSAAARDVLRRWGKQQGWPEPKEETPDQRRARVRAELDAAFGVTG